MKKILIFVLATVTASESNRFSVDNTRLIKCLLMYSKQSESNLADLNCPFKKNDVKRAKNGEKGKKGELKSSLSDSESEKNKQKQESRQFLPIYVKYALNNSKTLQRHLQNRNPK